MLYSFIAAIGLVFIFEGMLPFLAPNFWRYAILKLTQKTDRELRIYGFISMLLGMAILMAAHYYF
ncbi:MAG: DUF2065 domain-containing protein [Gammaproteobacteria bacterium]|nr:DUF2065 domain-containing protein [Gammaproteobacteria bacterium]